MARKPAYPPLAVYMNGHLAGRLRREASGAIEFRYAPDWIALPDAIPVSASLPNHEDRYTGASVAAFFDSLLPDDNEVRARIAEWVKCGGTDAHSLLGAIGRDCIGALQFLPEDEEPGPAGGIDGRVLDDAEVAAIIFLAPGGRFRLTPLYDILSAQPNVDAHQIKRNLFKSAMAVRSKRHYGIEKIAQRHFDQTAKLCRFDPVTARRIFDEVEGTAAAAIDRVLGALPPTFPAELAAQITDGVKARLARGGSPTATDLVEALGDA